jgi:hypothetical protein
VSATRIAEMRIRFTSVRVACRLPPYTPGREASVKMSSSKRRASRSWLKKNGRASVGGLRSRWELRIACSSAGRSVAATMSRRSGEAASVSGLRRTRKW